MSTTATQNPQIDIKCPKCQSADISLVDRTNEVITDAVVGTLFPDVNAYKAQSHFTQIKCNACGHEFEYNLLKHYKGAGAKTTKIVLTVVLVLLIVLGAIIYYLVKKNGGSFSMPQ